MTDDEEAIIKYALEVEKLLTLYRRVQIHLDRAGLTEFNVQFVLVEAMTAVAKLPVVRTLPEVPT